MKQLGLSSTETGIILGGTPFLSFLIIPVFGVIADKTRKPKVVLMICLIFNAAFYSLLLLTPRRSRVNKCDTVTEMALGCDIKGIYILNLHSGCILSTGNETALNASIFYTYLTDIKIKQDDPNNIPCSDILYCGRKITESGECNKKSYLNETAKSFKTWICQTELHSSDSNIETNQQTEYTYINKLNNISKQSSNTVHINCKTYLSSLQNHFDKSLLDTLCQERELLRCTAECQNNIETCNTYDYSASTFWIFTSTFLLANIFLAPISSLIDSIAYDILEDKRSLWGNQRLWGSVGYALFAMLSMSIVYIKGKTKVGADYSFSFYLYSGLCVLGSIIVAIVKTSQSLKTRQLLENIKMLLCMPKIAAFLLVITFISVFHFAVVGFLFWYLEDLGASQLIFGLCLVVNSITEILMLFASGKIINLVGHIPCLYVALLAYFVRFLCYSFLTNAWYVLPIELLHGVCFGLMYAAASAYASVIAPVGMSATVQGLMGGLYFGFGGYSCFIPFWKIRIVPPSTYIHLLISLYTL